MPSVKALCLSIASLTLCGCSLFRQPSPPPIPPLDRALAQPCRLLSEPPAPSYDAWQTWMQSDVLPAYGECAARHAATVSAWPK
jgi:hypothetical protein